MFSGHVIIVAIATDEPGHVTIVTIVTIDKNRTFIFVIFLFFIIAHEFSDIYFVKM